MKHIWNHEVTKKSVKQIKIYFIFFKVATLHLDDSFAHCWHSHNQLNLEFFYISLEGIPTYAEHLLSAFPSLCGPTHPKSSQLGWGRVIVEARTSDAALHHFPSWSNSPYTAWRCVLSHCPVEKQMSLTKPRWDGVLLQNVVVAMLAMSLEFEINHWQCHQQSTPTPSPPCFTVGNTHAEIICSATPRLTKTRGWNQKFQVWTHQTKGQISTGLMSIAHVSWPKQISYY
jgi:hypothetical protein